VLRPRHHNARMAADDEEDIGAVRVIVDHPSAGPSG
jgi:hypothetical protein